MGEGRGVYRVLVGKPGGKRPLGRHKRRWEDNIKMDIQKVGLGKGRIRIRMCVVVADGGSGKLPKKMKTVVFWSCAVFEGVTVCSVLRCAWDTNPCL
jgi:hypothetical protein